MRARLLQQLNAVLATRDTARGLIANMSDVLFKTGSFELMPAARERLAKVSGIVLAYPGLHLQVEGHTDSTGGDEFNQTLSEQRAGAVRDYLVQVDSGNPDLFLGKGYAALGPLRTSASVGVLPSLYVGDCAAAAPHASRTIAETLKLNFDVESAV